MPITEPISPKVFQYQQVADQLRRQIRKGILKPGDRLPSMREMRERYGVNFNTMEKVHALLDEEGLIVREQRKGAFVARPNLRPRTGVIGFCGIDLNEAASSPYWSPILAGARQALRGHDMHIMLIDEETRSGWEKIDGLLFNTAWYHGPLSHMPEMLPRVYLFLPPCYMEDNDGIQPAADEESGVVFDHYQGMRLATEHLLELGHRRIAYLHGFHQLYDLPLRIAGYTEALQAAGITPGEGWVRRMRPPVPKYDFREVGAQNMRLWLEEGWHDLNCTAILAQNDSAASGIIEVLQENGIRVPQDISVVGFDGIEPAGFTGPRLTTIQAPLFEVGEAAMSLLLHRIKNADARHESITLPVNLCIRETTGPAPN